MSAILGCSVLTGCAVNTSDEGAVAESELRSETVLFESDLRDNPDRSTIDLSCHSYTELQVVKTSSGTLKAKLENKLIGDCELAIIPDEREYTLTQSDDCGSAIYKGSKGKDSITIQDHRKRECEDVRASLIEVTEIYNGGGGANSYGEVKGAKPSPAKPTTPSAPKALLSAKLYDVPNATVALSCDVFTQLTVTEQDGKATATLANSVNGVCEIAILPDERSFEVEKSESCGSKIYTAKSGAKIFRAQDNASRLCEDIRPALVEANEGAHFYFSNP